jgi:hypothetical protein
MSEELITLVGNCEICAECGPINLAEEKETTEIQIEKDKFIMLCRRCLRKRYPWITKK